MASATVPAGKTGWADAKPCDLAGLDPLAEAKVSDARNTLAALMRNAQAAYEKEQAADELIPDGSATAEFAHALCASSTVVPTEVPKGQKVQPEEAAFHTGDAKTGWTCLRFEISEPVYYQYRYVQGPGYVGPARGLPNPGPDGFELSATGDLNGDGRTSVFTMVGTVDKAKSALQISHEVYCSDPAE
jgi:hypothetical protein